MEPVRGNAGPVPTAMRSLDLTRMEEKSLKLPSIPNHAGLLRYFAERFQGTSDYGTVLRFVVTETDQQFYHCEAAGLPPDSRIAGRKAEGIFQFRERKSENADSFNVVLAIPTGIGCDLGGHAGDAGPASRLIASICDHLILHPNVVNASDINEMSENSLYVEGSVLSRFLCGTVGLAKVRANRVLVVVEKQSADVFVNAAINAVNAARAAYGLSVPEIILLESPLGIRAAYSAAGRASGTIAGLEHLFRVLDERKGTFDAVALTSAVEVPERFHSEYFQSAGNIVNPWGGAEAMLTHAISHYYNVPSAHSPMWESRETASVDPGVVDSRIAAEAVSVTFLQSVLKGLQRSPRIVTDSFAFTQKNVLSVEDVSCLVIPDHCLGLPTLAALEQGIPVIAVRGNTNVMRNDLTALPWRSGQFHSVENYLEAVGVLAAIKTGIAVESVRRPLGLAKVNVV